MIESKRLKFRNIRVEDTDNVLKWRNSPVVQNNFIYRSEVTREDHLNWLKNRVETGQVIQLIITEKDTDKPIGSVYVRDIDKENMTGEYGIFIGEDLARGKGYGSETALRIVRYFFDDLKFKELTLRVLTRNTPAITSYKKAGFKVYKTGTIDIEGIKEDISYMSICNRDSIDGE